jgi:hypothetical protein
MDLYNFLTLIWDQINKGIYVWGGDGEILSEMSDPIAWIERHETSAKDAKRAVALYKKRVAAGVKEIRAFDCSGLVYWALHTLGLQKSDVSSRGLYGLCDKLEKTDLRDGDLVFHHDGTRIVHVGVYVGSGQVVECKGRDDGVVLTKRTNKLYWNRFGRWKAFEEPTPKPDPSSYIFTRQLKNGCVGQDVVELKKLLIEHGFSKGITTDTKSSERFGSSTKRLVKEYQKSVRLKVDGVAGHDTIISLGGIWIG